MENDPATVLDATATDSDLDSADFNGGSLTIDYVGIPLFEDNLGVRNDGTAAGLIGVSGSTLSFSGATIGTMTGGTGGLPLEITFTTANATQAAVQALLRNITYLDDSEVPSAASRTVRFVVNDGDGGTSVAVTKAVSVISVNDAPTITMIADPAAVLEDAGAQHIDLAGITAGGGESQPLIVTASSSNPTIIPHPTVSYASPDNTGSLTYTPVPNAYGTAVITVTVMDNGGIDDGGIDTTTRTFTVTVTPVNDQPTLAAIANPAPILQDAAAQTVLLSGIDAGPNEVQDITVTAVSSNPLLIPHPGVTYTSDEATGSLSYTPVPGASGVAVVTVTVQDSGGITDGGVDTVTRTFTVVVYAPVVVTSPPLPKTLNPGATASFTVAATGTAPITFQWRKNGQPIQDATEDHYSIPAVVEGDEGDYDVIVTNVVGPKTSDPAKLLVNNPVLINSDPVSLTLNQGERADFAVAVKGTDPITFQWRKDGDPIPGAEASTYSILSSQVSDEADYDVVVTNIVGSKTSAAASLTVLRGSPRIISQPEAQTVALDTAVSFVVKAGGSSPFTYEWRKNGVKIPGATTATHSIASVQSTDVGAYSVVVKNAAGSVTSDTAQLTVMKATAYSFSTLAGQAGKSGAVDGPGAAAKLFKPDQGVRDSHGNLFLTDRSNHTIRKVLPDGTVSVFAGAAGTAGTLDDTGTAARFNSPAGIGIDTADNLYVADNGSHLIRKVTPAAVVTTIAGTASIPGSADGIGTAASFRNPYGVAVDAAFHVYVADSGNHTVRQILPDGTVSTLAGSAGLFGKVDDLGSFARFNKPTGVAADSTGLLYVADEGNHAVRRIALNAAVTTIAGLKGTSGALDGMGGAARFKSPDGVGVDSAGNVFVCDSGNHSIRLITPLGRVTTIGGLAGAAGTANGLGSVARFRTPKGMIVESQGTIYLLDSDNHTLRKGTSIGLPQIDTPPDSLLVGIGQPAAFHVLASGGLPIGYQWTKNNVNIALAATDTFGFGAATLANAGTYRVVVKNSASSITSAGARLGVVGLTPSDVIVNETATVSLTASAAGDNLIFEWQKDGKPLAPAINLVGITTTKLTISKATIADAGSYVCSVRLGSLRLESGAFNLSVREKPVLNAFAPSNWTVSGTVTDAVTVVDNSTLNAPTIYSVTGLPAGMTFDTKTGQLGGKPNLPGTYKLTITATNAAGTRTAQVVTITVDPMPPNAVGTFNGLVDRDTLLSAPLATPPNQKLKGLGGSLNVVATSAGTLTGTLKLEDKSYILTGRLDAHGSGDPTAVLLIKRGTGIANLTMAFTINVLTGELTGTLTDGLVVTPVKLSGWRNPWLVSTKPALNHPATALAGAHTAALSFADNALEGDPAFPQGTGYGTLTVTTAGVASWAGVLADGVALTSSATIGPQGQVPLHGMLYTNTGSAHGWVRVDPGANASKLEDNLLDTMLDLTQLAPEDQPMFDWVKLPQPAASTTLSYKSGFALHKQRITGGGYVKPVSPNIVLGLADRPFNTTLTFSGGNLENSHTCVTAPTALNAKTFQITNLNKVVMPVGLFANPASLTLTLDPVTGAISGNFTLTSDPDPTDHVLPIATLTRSKVLYGGLLIPRLGIGVGQFQLPELPSDGPPKTTLANTPRWSGRVVLQAAP